MALAERQVQVRDLVMGPGTPYQVTRFNPFNRTTRANQTEGRAWNHGVWSGVEWANEKVVPISVLVSDTPGGMASWVDLDQQLAAAFHPIGEDVGEVELRFTLGGREYVLFGRPRSVEPTSEHVGFGWSRTQVAFVALDPRIYSGELHQVTTGLPTFTGGLIVPLVAPFTVDGALDGGRAVLLNDGTAEAGLFLRLDGPLQEPRVILQPPDGSVLTLRFDIELSTGQWLEVDTAAETVFLNGLPQSSQLGRTAGDFFLLPPGTSTLRFAHTGDHNATAQVTASFRDAWW